MWSFLRKVKRWTLYNARYKRRFEFVRPQLSIGLYHFAEDGEAGYWSIKFFFVWLTLWRSSYPPRDEDRMFDAWMFSIHPFGERHIYLHWRAWHRFISLPWSFDWIEHAVMNTAGEFVVTEFKHRGNRATVVLSDPLEPQRFLFRYQTRTGLIQYTTVTVKAVERRRWQWTFFRRLRLPVMVKTRHSLDLWFDDEMGNQRGSWKGGVLGTGCDYRPGEPIEKALRRFELRATTSHTFCR
jgi:hypothetical protein